MHLLNRILSIIAVALLLFGIPQAQAQTETQTPVQTKVRFDKNTTVGTTALFPLEEVRPGLKGTARTVFSGSEPEEFGVEILGLLDGFTGPRQSTIIARLSGPNVDKTGVFSGMSGSPVFIDNKLVGAIAYSFPFAKEPICGIT